MYIYDAMDWRKRLQDRMDELGLTPRDVVRRAGVNTTMVHDILKRNSTPSVENLSKIAHSVGLTLAQLYEGSEPVILNLRLSGVTTGAGMWADVPTRHAKVLPLTMFQSECVSVEVLDDSLAPRFDRGDIICGNRHLGPNLDNLIGLDCLVEQADGTRCVGILLRGAHPNLFSIRSLNPRNNDVRDVQIAWAAPISIVIRSQSPPPRALK